MEKSLSQLIEPTKNPQKVIPYLVKSGLKVAGAALVFTLVGIAVKKLIGWKEPVQIKDNNK